jgi:predicted GNAT family N-acyltransferase
MSDVRIDIVDWDSCQPLRDIRREVFIDEQQVPAEEEWDNYDATAVHFLMSVDGEPAGTARLLPDGHIGRVAIVRRWRGKGLGDDLMRRVMDHAREKDMTILALSAQTQALDFYTRLGFRVCSNEYIEAGIPHHAMILDTLQQSSSQAELPPIEFESPGQFTISNPPEQRERYASPLDHRLGEHGDLIEVDEDNALVIACDMALQARRRLLIHGADLAQWLFHRRDFLDCCEQIVVSSRRLSICVLVQDIREELLAGYSLVRLMQRFPSFCEVRRQHPDLPREPRVYMVADDTGILMFPRAALRSGFARYASADQARRWGNSFTELWSTSQSDLALRRLSL